MRSPSGSAVQAQAPEAWRREAPSQDCGLEAPGDAGAQVPGLGLGPGAHGLRDCCLQAPSSRPQATGRSTLTPRPKAPGLRPQIPRK